MTMEISETGHTQPTCSGHAPFSGAWQAESEAALGAIRRVLAELAAHEESQRAEATSNGKPRRRRQRGAQRKFETAARSILCEAITSVLNGHKDGFRCPRSKSILEKTDRSRSPAINPLLPQALDLLAHLDWIDQDIGYIAVDGERLQTVVRPGRRLFQLIDESDLTLDDFIQEYPGDEIILRERKAESGATPRDLPFVDDGDTRRLRAEMQQINAHLRYADLSLLSTIGARAGFLPNVDKRKLRRIFSNGSFAYGGRLYGSFWLHDLKSDERVTCIRIDGQPVVEVDHAQCALRILYSLADAQPPSGDLYAIPGLEQAERDDIKSFISALTFVDASRIHELAPFARKLSPAPNLSPDSDLDPLVNAAALRSVLKLIQASHMPIASFLPSEVGHSVQRIESDIMVQTLLTLNAKGVTALPVHDAVLVRRDQASETIAVMRQVFEAHIGIPASVRIKER